MVDLIIELARLLASLAALATALVDMSKARRRNPRRKKRGRRR